MDFFKDNGSIIVTTVNVTVFAVRALLYLQNIRKSETMLKV